MRIGALGRGLTFDEIARNVEADQAAGYASVWFSDGIGMDPLTLIGALGQTAPPIELGTAVVRTLPRHPMILAQQALTANALVGGRLTLGVGPSHRPAVEAAWGLPFEKPIARLRDYLSVLLPLLSGETVDFDGTYYTAHGDLRIQEGTGVSVLIAALGPQMLRLAGRLTDGTITTMAGPSDSRRSHLPNHPGGRRSSRPPSAACGFDAVAVRDRRRGRRPGPGRGRRPPDGDHALVCRLAGARRGTCAAGRKRG